MSLQFNQIKSRDLDDFAHQVRGFNLDFRPFGVADREVINITQSIAPSCHIGLAECSLRIRQHALAPEGLRTIAILPPNHPPLFWCGRPVIRDQFLLFASNGEMTSISNSGFKVITLSFPQHWLENICGCKSISDDQEKVISAKSLSLAYTWRSLTQWLNHLSNTEALTPSFSIQQEKIVRRAIVGLFCDFAKESLETRNQHHLLILNRALREIHQKKRQIKISQLSKNVGVSERTLERIFSRNLGLTPKEYLTYFLMCEVNHLLKYHGKNLTVSQIAWHLGFHHLGQFSNDYKRIIGEVPSKSLEKQLDCQSLSCSKK